MESDAETHRLDMKTDTETVKQQALWAGIEPGMRVADLGFGSGKTTICLNELVQPGGQTVGVDISPDRIAYATARYAHASIEYVCQNISEPLDSLGTFDFIWVRFVLEYHRQKSFQLVENISSILNPGGILCLIDLDYNCLSHFGLPDRLEKTLYQIMTLMQNDFDFDPYVGRKLYAYLYDLAFLDIRVNMAPHHLIYGSLNQTDAFNWTQKVAVAVKQSGFVFDDFPGGYDEFYDEFKQAFANPRRFTYTPVISCRGVKP
jgi:SAM-dependent methyltransferase